MTNEKHGSLNKHVDGTTKAKETMSQEKHAERNKFGDKVNNNRVKDTNTQQDPEEQITDPKLYAQRDKTDLNGPPTNQKI